LITDLLPYCKGILDPKYKHHFKSKDPKAKERVGEKRHRTTNAQASKVKKEAMETRHDVIEEEEEPEVIIDDSKEKPERDCEHGDCLLPQSIELSRLFAILYIVLLAWLGCAIEQLGMCD
jgi:hypothetical protein